MAYDSTTKRIYINTQVTPNVGVSIADVKSCLGLSSNDLGTLCTSDRINKWAKYKPFRSNMLNPTEAQRQDKNYGLFIPYYTTIQSMANDVYNGVWTNSLPSNSGRTPWGYEKPRGASQTPAEWYRLLDFNEYHGLVTAFVEPCPSTALIPVGSAQDVSFIFPYHYDPYAIAPSNIYPEVNGHADSLTPMYLGICLRASGASRYSWTLGPASDYDSASISNIYASLGNLGQGSYKVFLFLSSVTKTSSGAEQTAMYIPIPASFSTVSVQMETWTLYNLVATASQSSRDVNASWSVDLLNNASHAATVSSTVYDANGNSIGTYSGSVTLSHGTNTGTFSVRVSDLADHMVISIKITDAVHGDEEIGTSVYNINPV